MWLGNVRSATRGQPVNQANTHPFLVGGYLFSGDTLFPGGPGRTNSNADLQQSIESITTRLYGLPEATVVLTGHGDDTTIGESKKEYEVFAAKEHPADLHGDVLWQS